MSPPKPPRAHPRTLRDAATGSRVSARARAFVAAKRADECDAKGPEALDEAGTRA